MKNTPNGNKWKTLKKISWKSQSDQMIFLRVTQKCSVQDLDFKAMAIEICKQKILNFTLELWRRQNTSIKKQIPVIQNDTLTDRKISLIVITDILTIFKTVMDKTFINILVCELESRASLYPNWVSNIFQLSDFKKFSLEKNHRKLKL